MKYKLTRQENIVRMTPHPGDAFLRQMLYFPNVMSVEYDKRGNLNYLKSPVSFFVESDDEPDVVFFRPGFIQRVVVGLKKSGNTFELNDSRSITLDEDLSRVNLDQFREWQKVAVKLIRNTLSNGLCGILNAGTGSGKTFLITELCKIYSKSKIIVVSEESNPMRAVYQNLKADPAYAKDVGGFGKIGSGGDDKRIQIAHLRSLIKTDVDQCDLLICDECHSAAADKSSTDLAEVKFASMLGFSATPHGRNDNRDCFTESYFGPVIYKRAHSQLVTDGIVNPITVHIHPISLTEISADEEITKKDGTTYIRRKKFGKRMGDFYIRNDKRNRRIARILQDNYSDKSVIVLTQDNLEHVFRLMKYLPDYQPIYSPSSFHAPVNYGNGSIKRYNVLNRMNLVPKDFEPLKNGEEFALIDRFREGKLTKVIATSILRTGVDIPNLEVLCRADGESGWIPSVQSSGRLSRKDGDKKSILVDFFDNFGSIPVRRSQDRIKAYKDLKYDIKIIRRGK